MAISERLKAFLQAANVRFTSAQHPVVYTAQEIAAAQHVPGRQLAKSVLVKTDRGPVLAVLPAVELINLKKLKTLLKTTSLAIAKEKEVKRQFPDVEAGAMSPFGNLYQIPVVVDRALGQSEEIVFNAGSHTDTIKIRYQDFAALVKPTVGPFGQPISGSAKPKKGARPTGKKRAGPKTKAVKRRGGKKAARRSGGAHRR